MPAPKRNVNASKHGIWSLVAAMRGTRALDGRSVEALALKRTMLALASARGCTKWEDLSPQLQIIARRISFKDLICTTLENTALENGKQGVPETLWQAYLNWSGSLRGDLMAFGLERVPKDVPIPTIAEIKSRYEAGE